MSALPFWLTDHCGFESNQKLRTMRLRNKNFLNSLKLEKRSSDIFSQGASETVQDLIGAKQDHHRN